MLGPADDAARCSAIPIGVWKPDSNRGAFEEKLAAFLSSDSRPRRQAAARGLAGLGSRSRLLAATREAESKSRVSATAALVSLNPEIGVASAINLLSESLAEIDVPELVRHVDGLAGHVSHYSHHRPQESLNTTNCSTVVQLIVVGRVTIA